MNQFSNIGSMFPGAQFKNLRDNAKLALTLPGQHEIIGLVIRNCHGDITIIEKDKVRVLHAGQMEELLLTSYVPKSDAIKDLREKFDNMLAAEVHRHGGIPHLSTEELEFREAMAAFLEGGHDEGKTTGN